MWYNLDSCQFEVPAGVKSLQPLSLPATRCCDDVAIIYVVIPRPCRLDRHLMECLMLVKAPLMASFSATNSEAHKGNTGGRISQLGLELELSLSQSGLCK
jgi:hypothetical protein